jgi:integrase
MKRLIGMFRLASGEELLPPAIHQSLSDVKILKAGKTKAVELEEIRPVDVAIVEKTIPHLPPVVRDMVRFQSLAGCRPTEVCSIKPLMVNRSNTIWEIRFDKHKTAHRGKKRVIYVGPKAQAILLPYLTSRHEDSFCFNPRESMHLRRERNVPLSCGNKRGKSNTKRKTDRTLKDHYTTATYGNAIRRACRENKIPHWAPNQLRHLVGTNVRRELGIESASVILGHSNLSTTQIYAEANRELAIEAAKKMG